MARKMTLWRKLFTKDMFKGTLRYLKRKTQILSLGSRADLINDFQSRWEESNFTAFREAPLLVLYRRKMGGRRGAPVMAAPGELLERMHKCTFIVTINLS